MRKLFFLSALVFLTSCAFLQKVGDTVAEVKCTSSDEGTVCTYDGVTCGREEDCWVCKFPDRSVKVCDE